MLATNSPLERFTCGECLLIGEFVAAAAVPEWSEDEPAHRFRPETTPPPPDGDFSQPVVITPETWVFDSARFIALDGSVTRIWRRIS